MSHQVQVDYQAIAVRCGAVCDVAQKRLKELDDLMESVRSVSASLQTAEVRALEASIEKERDALAREIENVRAQADANARHGSASDGMYSYSDSDRYAHINNPLQAATDLQERADALASGRIIEFRSLIDAALSESIQTDARKARERRSGVVTTDADTMAVLDSIEDDVLRQFTHLAYIRDNTLTGDALRAAGAALMQEMTTKAYEQRLEEEKRNIRAELDAARVDAATAAKVMSADRDSSGATAKEKLAAVRESATQEIVGEKIRQKSMRLIMKAIQDRGFIVDKKNIKINRETNEVNMIALKASGEKAKFTVFLDGKFIYDFRGYEGQACQKDIQPFLDDLETVYGIHITDQKEIWSNPDKISNMHYQQIKTNKSGE